MTLDVSLLLLVAVFTLIGYFTGILRQILKVSCVVLSFFLSGPTAKFLTAYFANDEHIGPISSYGVVRIISWIGLYTVLRIVAFYLNRAVGGEKAGVLRPINRRLGGYLGFLEGVGLALVALWSLQIWINDKDTWLFPTWRTKAENVYYASWSQSSVAWRLASRWNPLLDYDIRGKLDLLFQAAQYPEVLQSLTQNANVKGLLNNPKVKAVLEDESFIKDIADHNYFEALSNLKLKAMMSDKEVQELMRKVHFFEILKEELSKIDTSSLKKKRRVGLRKT